MNSTTILENIDQLLSTARKYWLAAKSPEEKSEYMDKIDSLLDERLKFMPPKDNDEQL